MKLNKASLFSLYAVLELASDPKRQLSTSDIADKYGISYHHLTKIMHQLSHSGIVKSARGASGGCRFAGDVNRTTLFEVIQLFEEQASELYETKYGNHSGALIVSELQHICNEVDNLTKTILDSITLATALKSTRKHPVLGTKNNRPAATSVQPV